MFNQILQLDKQGTIMAYIGRIVDIISMQLKYKFKST